MIPGSFPWEWLFSQGVFPGNIPCCLLMQKGELIMTSVPFTQCCNKLGVDAKTLRQWLKTSSLALHSHPTDARIKCLTSEQVQQLATLHHRSIKEDVATTSEQASAPL